MELLIVDNPKNANKYSIWCPDKASWDAIDHLALLSFELKDTDINRTQKSIDSYGNSTAHI